MELEELAQRLGALEQTNAAANEQNMFNGFMDKYGMKFSQDGDLGVAILGELNRRGIDVSAADQAVQQILDQMRSEMTSLLDKIKSDERQISDMADKLNTIDEGVQAAQGLAPDAGAPPDMGAPPADAGMPPPDMGGMPPPPDMGAGGPPPDMGGAPPPDAGGPPPDMGGAPPDMGAGGPPPDMGGAPPPPPPPPPPPQALSDERIKNIRARIQAARAPKSTVLSDAGLKKPVNKFPAHLVKAVIGGI